MNKRMTFESKGKWDYYFYKMIMPIFIVIFILLWLFAVFTSDRGLMSNQEYDIHKIREIMENRR